MCKCANVQMCGCVKMKSRVTYRLINLSTYQPLNYSTFQPLNPSTLNSLPESRTLEAKPPPFSFYDKQVAVFFVAQVLQQLPAREAVHDFVDRVRMSYNQSVFLHGF